MSTELLRAISELIGALIWPLIIIVVLFFYRDSVKNILANLEEISLPGGFAAKIRKEARRAANQAVNKEEQAEGPTAVEIEAAKKIGIAAKESWRNIAEEMIAIHGTGVETAQIGLRGQI